MTTHHIFSRSFAALAAIFTLATGLALTAAPSTARAETVNQIVMSDGNIDCPPCRFFRLNDQDGMSFSNLALGTKSGGEVISDFVVTVTGTAGVPRTGSVVFSAFMDYTDDGAFIGSSDEVCTPSQMSRQTGVQACDAITRAFREASTAATTAPAAPSPFVPAAPAAEGIIMRDGGVCDPIRHMGC